MKKIKADPFDQESWINFRKALEDSGYKLRPLWSANDNITIWVVQEQNGVNAPKHRTIVTRHYDDGNGFGVWLESNTGKIDDGADEIIGRMGPPNWSVMRDGERCIDLAAVDVNEAIAKAQAHFGETTGRWSAVQVGRG